MAGETDRLKELFVAASGLAPAERDGLLGRECGDDEELRRRVEALLLAHDASGSYLRQPPPAPPDETEGLTSEPRGPGAQPPTLDYRPKHAPGAAIAGRYTLVNKIGEGGMGEVWVAKQSEPVKRKVALKIIKPGMDSRQVVARFELERQALALMDHPNIALVLDGGLTPAGQPFFVMELVNGLPLTQYCDELKLTPRERLELFVPVCQAVQHAHQKGVIHRDLKPSNILVTVVDGRGLPKVIDFGVAKATSGKLTDETLSTQFGSVVGTLEYMAPEQAGFSGQDVDTRADIYSLGVLLYELLTGLKPHDGRRLRQAALSEMLRIIQEDEPSKPSTRLSTEASLSMLASSRRTEPKKLTAMLRGELDWVVMKCLEKRRDRRYETANGLMRDIQRYLTDQPVEARPPSLGYRASKFLRRNKGPVVAAGVVAAALILGTIVSTSQWIRADRHAAREETLRSKEAALREEIARDLYTSDMIAIQRAWEDGTIDRMGELLDRHIPRAGQTDWRHFEWYVFRRRFQEARPRRTLPLDVGDLAATPNGPTVAFLSKGQAILWDAATGREPRVFAGLPGRFDGAVALSPNGKVFATESRFDQGGREGSFVNIWNAATGEPQQSLGGQGRRRDGQDGQRKEVTIQGPLVFSSDGEMLISGSSDNSITLWDLHTGRDLRTFQGHTAVVTGVALTPDGRRIASASYDNTVRLWDAESGEALFTSPKLPGVPVGVAFSAGDGRYLAAGSFGPGARLWDVADPRDPRPIELRGQPDTMTFGVSFSPDGRTLATSDSNRIRLWIAETGEPWATLKGHASLVGSVVFLDGGRMLASASQDRTVKLWDIASAGAEPEVLTGHKAFVYSLAFTTDGKTLASGGSDGSIKLWDMESGRERPHLEDPGEGQPISGGATSRVTIQLATHGRTLADNHAHLWDLETGRLLKGVPADRPASLPVRFSPDGATLATASSGTVSLWDVATRELRQSPLVSPDFIIHALTFTPDGRTLATGGEDQIIRLWDLATGRELAELDHRSGGHTGIIETVAFSPDGQTLVSGGWDGTAKVWDVAVPARPSLRHTLKGHAGLVKAVAYAPDGRTIASGSADKTIKLWDPTTGRDRCTLVGHTGRVLALAFSPDGTILASGDTGGTIRVWRR